MYYGLVKSSWGCITVGGTNSGKIIISPNLKDRLQKQMINTKDTLSGLQNYIGNTQFCSKVKRALPFPGRPPLPHPRRRQLSFTMLTDTLTQALLSFTSIRAPSVALTNTTQAHSNQWTSGFATEHLFWNTKVLMYCTWKSTITTYNYLRIFVKYLT